MISERTGLPLVMHGGSGVSPEDYRTGIARDLRKNNYYSYMSKDGTQVNIIDCSDRIIYNIPKRWYAWKPGSGRSQSAAQAVRQGKEP